MTRVVRVRRRAIEKLLRKHRLVMPEVKIVVERNLKKNGIDLDRPYQQSLDIDGKFYWFLQEEISPRHHVHDWMARGMLDYECRHCGKVESAEPPY